MTAPRWDQIEIRVHRAADRGTLIYLPGLHGDWTLVSSFRAALSGRICFVEITYPRTTAWSLADYATAVTQALRDQGITSGWLLGESFGSQVAWTILEQANGQMTDGLPAFHAEGLILAGGFVRYPADWRVQVAKRLNRAVPMRLLKAFCLGYAQYAKLRHRHAPETLASVAEFVRRRGEEADRQAILHRYDLILRYDARPVAQHTRLPVHQLAGFFDPIVPWIFVRRWLKQHCSAYRGWRLIWRADHNVLGTAPQVSAEQVLAWMTAVNSDQEVKSRDSDHTGLRE